MALRNIVKDGDPILTKRCRPVEKFDSKLHTLLDDMAETMHHANGVGLAASSSTSAPSKTTSSSWSTPKSLPTAASRRATRAACPSRDSGALSSARATSRSRHRIASARSSHWREPSCWHAPSATRSTISTAWCSRKSASACSPARKSIKCKAKLKLRVES